MSTFPEEIVAYLVAEGVGVANVTIFYSSGANLPSAKDAVPYLNLKETGGTGQEKTHNSIITPAYVRPGMQVKASAVSYKLARNLAQSAYNALTKVRNQTLSGVYYRELGILQEVFDMGPDDKSRSTAGFNFIVTKRPS